MSVKRSVMYVGKKESKADNVTDSGLVWRRGQIHEVPASYAVRLVAFPDIWRDVTDLSEQELGLIGAQVNPAVQAGPVVDPEKAALRDEIEVLRRQVDVLDSKLKAAETLVASLRQENHKLTEDRAALREQVETLSAALVAPDASQDAGAESRENILPLLLPDLGQMGKKELIDFAKRKLNLEFDPKEYPETMRERIKAAAAIQGAA